MVMARVSIVVDIPKDQLEATIKAAYNNTPPGRLQALVVQPSGTYTAVFEYATSG
jgi:hypothetical protein